MKNNKGQLTFFLVFFVAAIIIILVASIISPIGVLINTEFYGAGEDILNSSLNSLANIDDPAIRASLNNTITDAQASTVENIEINSAIFKYSWVLVLIALIIIILVQTRLSVEFGSRGGIF